MTILSAYHTAPTLQVRARKDAGAYATKGPITLTSPAAWYGARSGAAAGEDLLRGLYLLVLATMAEAEVTAWRIDTSGRLVIGLTGATYTIDWDHADTLLPPEYLGLDQDTTGTTTWAATTTTNARALPYLWHAGQDAALDHEEERAQEQTEQTTRGFLSPIFSRRYVDLDLEYDLVSVDRVLGSEVNATLGEWSTAERWLRGVCGPPILPWLYLPEASAQTVLTAAGEAVDAETWGPYQVRRVHLPRPLGESQRGQDTPERWTVAVRGETYAE